MKFDYDQDATFVQVAESAKFMMGLVDFVTAVEIPKQFGEDFPKVILAYRDQSEGKKLNLRPDLRKKVNQLTEFLADYSRHVDGVDAQEALETEDKAKEAKVFGYNHQQIKEELSPVLDALAELGIPQESLDKAVKFTAVVTETLTDLVGDEETALEVYDQLDPAFAPLAVLAYRKQAEGYFFAEGELEPEIHKEVNRLTEILAQLSREEEAYEDDWREFPDYDLPPEVKDRINRLVDRLVEAFGEEPDSQDSHDPIDHYEDYRVNAKQWPSEEPGYAYGEDVDSAHQRLQEDIVRAARKNGGYVLATREVWAKPVAKTDDGRWVFETEYGLEYLDFEDYEFEPEFDSFEDEESLVDFD
nr:MAG TPA: hypothetical protein [Caudoviricetes sp.]DAX96146.1 MAG TPA: hypothetical protein [Bacteriophage sp.]